MCGGTRPDAGFGIRRAGLSPRVRGNRRGRRRGHSAGGSIPACAGEPFWASPSWAPAPVYPRVCGGTRPAATRQSGTSGLSPRVRGNHIRPHIRPPASRSIPACAGEPQWRWLTLSASGVYPRVCGGTMETLKNIGRAAGLSPRVRGNPRYLHDPPGIGRSIPACAGEPALPARPPGRRKVYPRVCGGTVRRLRLGGQC